MLLRGLEVVLTCVHFNAGFFAHVSQLDDDIVFATWLQISDPVLYRAVLSNHFEGPLCLCDQILHRHNVVLQKRVVLQVKAFSR